MNDRLTKARSLINDFSLLIENPIDISYLTQIPMSAGKLLICPEETYLIVDGRYFEGAQVVKGVKVILDSETALQECLKKSTKVHFDGSSLSYEKAQELINKFPNIRFTSLNTPLKELRAVKESEEITKLKIAADLGSKGYDFLLTQLREGVSEKTLASKLHLFWIERGGNGLAFEPIIAFGANAALPHHRSSHKTLKKGDTVLLDIGVVVDGYHSDMTRTVFFGKPPEEMLKIYAIVKKAHEVAKDAAKPGISVGELDRLAREVIELENYGDKYTHGLGQGVGTEIHEWPFLKNRSPFGEGILKENMCVTIEPGIYLPGVGGVRIEDTYLVTSSGVESLTRRSQKLMVLDV